ncbi:PaaI family thioesterase [Sphingomicrobium flavum]|uniref:PaaI family thioesterase n=1 Tax=Sphingomicrobium flavum TaxID=1229164 RepID=UPI0021ADECB3|nr:PaaI family thioesterase [Sphingomicrobium flavum]
MSAEEAAAAEAILSEPFNVERFFDLVSHYGHGKAVGYRYHDHGDNWVELKLEGRPELVGVADKNILASGAVISLVDMCGGASVYQAIGMYEPLATIDLRIDYLRPAFVGDTVYARCECYKLTNTVAFVRGTAFLEGDRQVANVTGTYMRRP